MATMEEAKAALLAHHFGFVEDESGALVRVRDGVERTRFVPVDGGFEHYFRGEKQAHSLKPPSDPAWDAVYAALGQQRQDGVLPRFMEGHTPETSPQFYQWVWPPDEIVKVYGPE